MKSYFRFLWKHKSLTLIQILGVSLGLSFAIPAVSLLVKLWQMDHDNPEYRNIYGVCTAQTMSFASEDDYLVDTYPEVEDAVMFMTSKNGEENDVTSKDVQLKAMTMYCNPDMTGIFPLEMSAGSIESLALDNRIILSKEFASKLSESDLMGSVLTVNDKEYVVGGIYDSFDSQKIPYADIILGLDQHFDGMKSIFSYTFIRLKDGTDGEKFEEKLRSNETERFASNLNTNVANVDIRLVRYDRMSTNGRFYFLTSLPSRMAVLLVSALILLFLIAIFNFTNLSIAMSTRRAWEMATRQLLGSTKSDIWKQVFLENIVFTAVCFMAGMLLAYVLRAPLEFLFSLADESSLSSISLSPAALVSYVLLIVAVGVLTGIAPARSITRFSALDVVKGEFRAKEKRFLSKALIVFHGVLTVAIVFLTLVELAQVRHNSRIDFGCDIDDVCFVSMISLTDAEKEYVFQALSHKPYVSSMGYSNCLPGNFLRGMKFGDDIYDILDCDQGAFDAFGFRVKEDLGSRGKSTLWLSESLKERLAGRDLTGNEISGVGADVVGGTIETVLLSSRRMIYTAVYPVVVVVAEGFPAEEKTFLVLKTTGDHREISEDISKTVTSALHENSGTVKNTVCDYFRPHFYRNNFRFAESILKLMKVYALFMLILSLLGILGISTYNMQVRRHDMAVRKVFGSSTKAEVLRNVRSYSILMLIANAIGLPVGFKLAPMLNSNLASKVAPTSWMFVVTFLFTMLAVICVCLVQSWYTASANPVDSIKSE